ncbi:MAG: CPA2 family monovalent cation:H+ antiporter-2 [Cellvibrionaceae bacterium]|jgi:CPA2 family monovalent cation:H+ antiporter-2
MHEANPLETFLFFLLAAVISVPLFRRLRLGAILGYLFAGVIMGPQVLQFIDDPESILHFSEIGVVLLLFVIGLELNPDKLWAMRHQIGFLGGGQLLLSTLLIGLVCLLQSSWQLALIIGLALALSSTAFAVQLMAEKGILASANGRRGFSILLMQDLAVIPILLIVQGLAESPALNGPPWWYGVLAVALLFAAGQFLLNPLLNIVARFGSRETMTATALLIVVGAAYLMYMAGLSMGVGAFIAGIMLANSHFRHQLETDIEPFKGLTLGLFFIAIGMTLNIELLSSKPFLILLFAIGLMLVKSLIIMGLLVLVKVNWRSGLQIGLMLSQGGEFAFVIMGQAGLLGLVSTEISETVNLVVGLSMALTAPLLSFVVYISEKFPEKSESDDSIQALPEIEKESEILILGFGRFAQITGRILAANKIPFTALDNNPSHIEFIKRFGSKIHFGDVTRLDVLQSAGIDQATTLLLTIENADISELVIKMVREHYPDLNIIARAYNRVNYLKLIAAGANKVIREMFPASLDAAKETLSALGFTNSQSIRTVEIFRDHDESLLEKALEHHNNLDKVIEIGIQGRKELEDLFAQDKDNIIK